MALRVQDAGGSGTRGLAGWVLGQEHLLEVAAQAAYRLPDHAGHSMVAAFICQ